MLLESDAGLNSLLDCISKPSAPLLQAVLESTAHLDTGGAGIPSQHAEHLDRRKNTPSHPHTSPGCTVLGWSHEMKPLAPLAHDLSLDVFSPRNAHKSSLPSPDDHSSAGASRSSVSVLEMSPQDVNACSGRRNVDVQRLCGRWYGSLLLATSLTVRTHLPECERRGFWPHSKSAQGTMLSSPPCSGCLSGRHLFQLHPPEGLAVIQLYF